MAMPAPISSSPIAMLQRRSKPVIGSVPDFFASGLVELLGVELVVEGEVSLDVGLVSVGEVSFDGLVSPVGVVAGVVVVGVVLGVVVPVDVVGGGGVWL